MKSFYRSLRGIPFALASFALVTPASNVAAEPLITEFMASNRATIADEDGDFSDWIEIHNPTPEPVSLAGWTLTDNAADLSRWTFPSILLEPGEFRIIWASNKNRRSLIAPLHTNFALSADGEYLALVRPDGSIKQDFGVQFPAQQEDESFGLQFHSSERIAAGASARFRVRTSDTNPPAGWEQPGFNDAGWGVGASGFGFGMTTPGITVRHVFKNGNIQGLADAVALTLLPDGNPTVLRSTTVVAPYLNFLGEGSLGRFGNDVPPPGGSGDQYAIRATGFVEIPYDGFWTFGTNTDDGGRVLIDGTVLIVDDAFHGPEDRFGSRFLTRGSHTFDVTMFEGGGGDCLEFFAAPGNLNSWDASKFRLVGDVANGGLAASTASGGGAGLVKSDLSTAMASASGVVFRQSFTVENSSEFRVASLLMRHNDGFAAWLNGERFASHNVPENLMWDSVATASRGNPESLRRMPFNATSGLVEGTNLLAIHGLNVAPGDPTFLIVPELIVGEVDAAALPAFFGDGRATPGWINGEPSLMGKVAPVQVSVSRGFFDAPFSLTLESPTPGATIRYTTDGSTPTEASTLYTAPLQISATTPLRAQAFFPNWEPSPVITHTYFFMDDVIRQSPNGAPAPGWPSSSGTSQVLDYGMDPDIVNHSSPAIGGAATVKSALLALPCAAITTDLPNLFNMGGSQGIYSNPHNRGLSWERPASLEWLAPPTADAPNGSTEFQINAGIRIRGGFSRATDNPKHSFRFYFRSSYGEGKLRYPLFGDAGASVFDKIDFRTAQNYSWSFGGDDNNTFMREEASRLTQLEMGQPASHLRYVHLFINGQYWGLYNLDERKEADFAATYFGGEPEDYDSVKAEQAAGYTTNATDGNLEAWNDLFTKAKSHRANPSNANYFRLMGLAADGVTPTDDPVLLDVDNLIDYMLLTFWMGNLDGCTSAFLGDTRANNWSGSRRRVNNPRQGFRFFAHDFEHSLFNVNENRTGPFHSENEANPAYYNPMFIHQDLMANVEYRMRWADRAQKHMFREGALAPSAWNNRMERLAAIIDPAIAAESARWGDAKSGTPKTRQTWLNAKNSLMSYFSPRSGIVLNQLRADGLYPSIDAPSVLPRGGSQPLGTELVISGPAGAEFYYMPDGSDPRMVGGGVRPGALTHQAALTQETLIPWSAHNWKYLASGANLGAAWREPGYNDSGWPTGQAEIGYGDGDEATAIPVPPNPKPATCYFRRTFQLASTAGIGGLKATIEYDDSYVIYLNGVRVAGNLPVDPPFDYYGGSAIEDTTETVEIDPSLLVEGTNLIAVEIHQTHATSSDLSMNLSLTAARSSTAKPLLLTEGGERTIRLRAKTGANWSALVEANYLVGTDAPQPLNLAISKIMYHPSDPSPLELAAGFASGSDFEYLEIINLGELHVDLRGVRLAEAVSFDFTGSLTGYILAPGERLLVVNDLAAFEFRYGSGFAVAGEYSGNLNNSGETILLLGPSGEVLREVTYGDSDGWSSRADGDGPGLVARFPGDPSHDRAPGGWRASGGPGGSPGAEDPPAVGSYDAWAATRFSPEQLAQATLLQPDADPDEDGRANFMEFALGTDPLEADAEAVRLVWQADGESRHPALEFTRPRIPLGVEYVLLASDTLEGWSPIPSITHVLSTAGELETVIVADATEASEGSRFLRLQVRYSEP
jgi:hypothetical protein